MIKLLIGLVAIIFLPHIVIAIGIYYLAYRFWKKVYEVGEAIHDGKDVMDGGSSSDQDGTEFHSTGAPYL